MSQAACRAPCYAPLIPAKAGIQLWVPAFAGTTEI